MTNRQCVRAIVIHGDKMLAMKRNKFGMQYVTLIGGGVDLGEDAEAALRREVREETGMEIGAIQLVWVEDAGSLYGEQFIYLCEYKGGDPQLAPDSEEMVLTKMGKNLYEPVWLPLQELPKTVFRSDSAKQAILGALQTGFPKTPERLAWKPESVGQ